MSASILISLSAGVDPVSRRALWEILLERKADLAILLVTHYTDEADILSDQVMLDCGSCPPTQGMASGMLVSNESSKLTGFTQVTLKFLLRSLTKMSISHCQG